MPPKVQATKDKEKKKGITRQSSQSLVQSPVHKGDTVSAKQNMDTTILEAESTCKKDHETDTITTGIQKMMTSLEQKLDRMVSQEFIENKLKSMITPELLTKTLQTVKDEITSKIQEELTQVNGKIKSMRSTVE